eukprot:4962450-Pyramimonas_sp.AAC.1
MVDNSGAHIQRGSPPDLLLRPSNGRCSPGIKCPESLYSRVTDLHEPGARRYFKHGTKWANILGRLSVGLSCQSEDNPKKNSGRQMIHGC